MALSKIESSSIATALDLTNVTVDGSLTVDTSTLVVDNANNRVGIGTASPGVQLDVVYSLNGGISTRVFNTNTDASSFAETTTVGNDTTLRLTAYGSTHGSRGGTAWLNVNEASRSLVLSTGNIERMRIDSSGNVGIGNSIDNSTRRLAFTTVSGGSSAIESVTNGFTDQSLVFKTTYATEQERMRINGLGNVGIGVTNPLSRLSILAPSTTDSHTTELRGYRNFVAQTYGATSLIAVSNQTRNSHDFGAIRFEQNPDTSDGGGSLVRLFAGGSSSSFAANSEFLRGEARGLANGVDNIQFRTAGTERMRINVNGNVGIGTSSPSEKLEVVGGAVYVGQANLSKGMIISSIGSMELFRDDSVAYIDFKTTNAEDFDCRIQQSNNGLNFYVGGNGAAFARFQLQSDGAVYMPSNISNGAGKSALVIEDGANTGEEGGVEIRAFAPRLLLVDRSTGSYTVNMVMDGVNFSWYQNVDADRYTTKGTERFRYGITTGNAYNTTGTWGTISDQKLKENIVDATPKLESVKQLQVRNFNLIGEDLKQIGFVAQEIEQVFPNIVDTQINEEDNTETKYVKTTVLIPILTKALQEAITKIESLEARIQTLEGN